MPSKKATDSNLTWDENAPERRNSIADTCIGCSPARRCCLARATWFQQIRTVRVVGRNATVFRQGEPADKILTLKRGWLQATHMMPNGKAITDLFGPGSIFGIECAAANADYPYTAVAIEECEMEEVDSQEFLEHLKSDPLLAVDVLRHVSRTNNRLMSLFFASASKVRSAERLLKVLEDISMNCSTVVDEHNVRINLPLSVQVLADHIGCSRQWVSKMLGDLEKKGALQRKGTWITFTPNGRSKPPMDS